jgi:hypothetical protein
VKDGLKGRKDPEAWVYTDNPIVDASTANGTDSTGRAHLRPILTNVGTEIYVDISLVDSFNQQGLQPCILSANTSNPIMIGFIEGRQLRPAGFPSFEEEVWPHISSTPSMHSRIYPRRPGNASSLAAILSCILNLRAGRGFST